MQYRRNIVLLMALAGAVPLLQAQTEAEDDLWAAARKGDLASVKAAIGKGAAVEAKTRHGLTALFYAAQNGHLEVVKYLVEQGASVNVTDSFYGMSALGRAAGQGQAAVVKFMLEHGAKGADQALVSAATDGKVDVVAAIVEKGGLSEKSMTQALQAAQRKKDTMTVGLLTKAGAKPPIPPKFVEVDAAKLAGYAGTWRSPQMDAVISVKDGKLSAMIQGQTFVFGALSETKFQGVEMDALQMEFSADGLKITQNSFTLQFKKVEAQ